MFLIVGTAFAAVLGLAFGSFLNVCATRWPADESVAAPRSHCRGCGRTLRWWENVPVASWLALRGRCRTCRAWIGWRYPLVELSVAALWAESVWEFLSLLGTPNLFQSDLYAAMVSMFGRMLLFWLLVALAVLDAENFWLPDLLTWPGIVLGFGYTMLQAHLSQRPPLMPAAVRGGAASAAVISLISIVAAAGLILVIRFIYRLARHQEGIGLGDAKLMALLGAWLGFPQAVLAFVLAVLMGAVVATVLLAVLSRRKSDVAWGRTMLPLGTFLCIGGIVSALWGEPLIAAYLHWTGFY